MNTKDPRAKPELSLVPKEEAGPASFESRDLSTFKERRIRKDDRRESGDRRAMIRFEPGKEADRRSLHDRRRAGNPWNGYNI